MKKPFGINFITFVSLFQIIFSAMTLLFIMFVLGMTVEAGSDALAFQQIISVSLFNRPIEALTLVHYSIIVIGTLLPAILLIMAMRMIKSKNLKVIRSIFIVKIVLDILRASILNVVIDIMMIVILFKDKQTLRYFTETDDKKL
ncbi:MAG: hypothetical protein WBA54_10430 [Acidaminobacteraceae bacterium]